MRAKSTAPAAQKVTRTALRPVSHSRPVAVLLVIVGDDYGRGASGAQTARGLVGLRADAIIRPHESVEVAIDEQRLRELLEGVAAGTTGVETALEELRLLPYEDLGFAKIDTHRSLRKGFPEVIFCEGKTVEQIVSIVDRLSDSTGLVMATRAGRGVYDAVRADKKDAVYHEQARIITVGTMPERTPGKPVAVISAGTSDLPVAEEAAVTAEAMGSAVDRLYDVGVAGIHRLFGSMDRLEGAGVVIVVAGMEGALASIVGGLVGGPVVAVPTSVGYGASFGGLSALLTMLNSCAPGVVVVNIDNGFGAGYFAGLLNAREDE